MSEQQPNKWDLKQVGSGAGLTALSLFLMQSQGVDLISKNQDSRDQIIIEKTLNNAARIDRVEGQINNLSTKIDAGFESVRMQMKDQLAQVLRYATAKSEDRYTKTEHLSYEKSVDKRFDLLTDEIRVIRQSVIENSLDKVRVKK